MKLWLSISRILLTALAGAVMLLPNSAMASLPTPTDMRLSQMHSKGTSSLTLSAKYTPYGTTLINPASNNDQAGFTGHIKDSATGLTYMQARYYDPLIGRFLSIDPVGFSVGQPQMFNRYAYVGNDPVNNIDPDGKDMFQYHYNPDTGNFESSGDHFFDNVPDKDMEAIGAVVLFTATGGFEGFGVKSLAKSFAKRSAKRAVIKAEVKKRTKGLRKQIAKHKQKIKDERSLGVKPDMVGKTTKKQQRAQRRQRRKKHNRDIKEWKKQIKEIKKEVKRENR